MGSGKIKEEARGAGAELARMRVEGGEAVEVIGRHITRDIAGYKKDSDYFRVRLGGF